MDYVSVVTVMYVCELLSCVSLFATPWTVACQAPLSMEFSRHEYWSRLPFPSPTMMYICFYFGEHINLYCRLFWGLKFYHSESNQNWCEREGSTQDSLLLVVLIPLVSVQREASVLCIFSVNAGY